MDKLLGLMAERLATAPQAAMGKWNAKAPIEDPQQEREIIDAIVAAAPDRGLDAVLAREFFQAQIEASKLIQHDLHRRWLAARQPPFENTLDPALRPVLDRLTPKLLSALATAASSLPALSTERFLGYQPPGRPTPAGPSTLAWRVAVGPLVGAGTRARNGVVSRLDSVQRTGLLRICTTGDYAPFSRWVADRYEFEGSDIDLGKDLASALAAEPVFIRTTWSTLMADYAVNRCDVAMGGVSITLDRQKQAFFSVPYLIDGKTPIARCVDAAKYQTLEQIDVPLTRVVVNPGGTNEKFVRTRIKRAQVTVHPDNTTIFDEILAGRSDVMITDAVETRLQQIRHPGLCAIHPSRPFTYSEKAYLLPLGDVYFKAFVDQWLHFKIAGGEYAKVQEQWLK